MTVDTARWSRIGMQRAPNDGMVIASVIETDRIEPTYNLTVADFETYFVGEARVLVRNCPPEGIYKFQEGDGVYVGQSVYVEPKVEAASKKFGTI